MKRSKVETVKAGSVRVKIYRRDRQTASGGTRTIYEVADYSGGTRRLRGFSAHGEARQEAERIARQIASGEATAAQMLNTEAASYGRAVELLRPTGAPLEVAAGVFAEAWKILGGDRIVEAARFYSRHQADQVERRTVSEVVAELLAAKEARGKSARTIGDLRARLGRFAGAFKVDIGSVTTGDIQRWLDGLKLGPQSIKNYRATLSNLFGFAEARGYVFKGGNPVADTEAVSARGGEIAIYTPGELSRLLEAAPADYLPTLAIQAFAGLRSAEVERIDWSAVDLRGGFIHIGADDAKTRSRRLVPIAPCLADWLAPYAKRTGPVWPGTANTIRKARAATVEKSGVPWKDNALRHSFASYRLAEIQDAARVALELGNSPSIVFRHYRELVKPGAAAAWFSVRPDRAEKNIVSIGGAA